MGTEDNNSRDRVKSIFGSVFNSAKGYVEEKSRQAKETQEVSSLLNQVFIQKDEIARNSFQLFFSNEFGKRTNSSQKQQFITRRCLKYRQMVPLEQNTRDDLIRKVDMVTSMRENNSAYAEKLRSLIFEIESYKAQLSRNQVRMALNNNNNNAFNDLRKGFEMILNSQILIPREFVPRSIPTIFCIFLIRFLFVSTILFTFVPT